MKNIKIILAVLTLLLLGGGVYYYGTILEEQKIAEEKAKAVQLAIAKQQAQLLEEQKKLKCEVSGDYFVVTRDHENNLAGQNILVNKNTGNTECKYSITSESFEIANSDPEFYKSVQENALVTDVGTGPSGRSFRLYDLTDKKMITEKKYFGEMSVKDGKLTYFGLSKTKADAKNCTEYKTLMKDIGNANLVVEKVIDLKTFSVKEGKTTKCLGEQ